MYDLLPYTPRTPRYGLFPENIKFQHVFWPFLSHFRPFFTLFKTPKKQYVFCYPEQLNRAATGVLINIDHKENNQISTTKVHYKAHIYNITHFASKVRMFNMAGLLHIPGDTS